MDKFLSRTSLHGLKYLSQSRSRGEKIFWIFSFIISIILTLIMIFQVYKKYTDNPIVIVSDNEETNLLFFDYPSITLSLPLIMNTKFRKIIDYNAITEALMKNKIAIDNLTMNELKFMQIISLTSRDQFFMNYNITIPTDDFIEKLKTFPDLWEIDKKNPPFVENFYGNWSNYYTMNFTETLCPAGLCATFNFPTFVNEIFNLDEISSDFHYKKFHVTKFANVGGNLDPLEYPVTIPNAQNPFLLVIRTHQKKNGTVINMLEEIHSQEQYKSGVKFFFHDPYEMMSNDFIGSRTMDQAIMKVTFSIEFLTIDDSLDGLKPLDRNCYMNKEKLLRFFTFYQKKNCEHECMSNLTSKICGCVEFFLPRDDLTRICGVADEKCVINVEESFPIWKRDCECLDVCEDVRYEIKIDNTGFINPKMKNLTGLHVYTDLRSKSLAKFRKLQFKNIEIVSYIGGILGLFAGFSLMSLIEILNFSILQPLTNLYRRRFPQSEQDNSTTAVVNFFNHIFSYLEYSSITSFNYIAVEKSKIVKVIWLVLSGYVMYEVTIQCWSFYDEYKSEKIGYKSDGNLHNIDEIPFPAVTFSSDFISDRIDYYRDINKLEGYDEKFVKKYLMKKYFRLPFIAQHLACHWSPKYFGDYRFEFDDNPNMTSEVAEYFLNLHYRLQWIEESSATWNSNPAMFQDILIKQGMAYTFNMMKVKDLFTSSISEDFLVSKDYNESTPHHAMSNGASDFVITFKKNPFLAENLHKRCFPNSFQIHSPFRLPSSAVATNFDYGSSIEIILTPEVVRADENIRSIDYWKRECVFEDEIKLNLFKIYTAGNCLLECNVLVVYKICKCAPHHYPRWKFMAICDIPGLSCAADVMKMGEDYVLYYGQKKGICHRCFKSCEKIDYKTEIVNTKFDKNYNKELVNETTITVRYKYREFYPLIVHRLYTFQNFVSKAGGFVGLLVGASFLSIIEFIYFFTIRIISNSMILIKTRKLRKKKRKILVRSRGKRRVYPV